MVSHKTKSSASVQFIVIATMLLTFLSSQAQAAKPEIYATENGAIEGYDPVAYFVENQPRKGLEKYTLEWKGAIFKFANAENLATFKAAPEKYTPQYGGYCAYAASLGSIANTEPEAWTIVDGKLYLNYNKQVRSLWSQNTANNITKANNNWPHILN